MVNRTIDDQFCLNKIRSVLDYDLNQFSFRLSFSDSDLQYLTKPFVNSKVNKDLKLKYLNCFKVSMQIQKFKQNLIKTKKNRSNSPNSQIDNLSLLNYNNPNFDIDKIHNYRDNRSLISSSSDDLSMNMNSLDSSQFNFKPFNELDNKSNIYKQLTKSDPELYSTCLLSYLEDSKDQQLFFLKTIYSTFKSLNLLDKFRIFKKKSVNFFTIKPEVLKTTKTNLSENIFVKDENAFLSRLSDDSLNCQIKESDQKVAFDFKKDSNQNLDNDSNKSLDKDLNQNLNNKGLNENLNNKDLNENLEEQTKDQLDDVKLNTDSILKDNTNFNVSEDLDKINLDKINLDKVISCVDLKRKFLNDKEPDKGVKKMNIDASISSLDQDELNLFLNSSNFESKSNLDKNKQIENINNDQNSTDLRQMKPIRTTSDFITPFLRLNLLDNFLTRTLTSPFSLTYKTVPNENVKLCNCNQNATSNQCTQFADTDNMDVIDLNDENNYKFYKESIFDSFDLDIKDEEAIKLEFDKKFETFFKGDLEKFNKSHKIESSNNLHKDNYKDNYKDNFKDIKEIPADISKESFENESKINFKDSSKKDQFDSIKRLTFFQSKIPVLKRDKSQFSKAILDKLKIKYDPLKARKKSKELIDTLNEDYMNRFKDNNKDSNKDKHKISIGTIDKADQTNNAMSNGNKIQRKDTESLKSIKNLKEIKQSNDHSNRLDSPDKLDKDLKASNYDIKDNENQKHLKDTFKDFKESSKFNKYRPSKIPKFMHDEESVNETLLMNRKKMITNLKKSTKASKGDKLYKLIREVGILKGIIKDRPDEPLIKPETKQDYQYLKKCVPRTRSEFFINEELNTNRVNETFRHQLLELDLKTNGSSHLFQLYDYFDNFKDKLKDKKYD